MRSVQIFLCALIFSEFSVFANASNESDSNAQAREDYIMNCQGCHSPTGAGNGDVPAMDGYIGHFFKVDGGREFLVQVPGAANAALDDKRLATMLNWMIAEFGGDSLPANLKPYSTEEVGSLRVNALTEVNNLRGKLVDQIDQVLAQSN